MGLLVFVMLSDGGPLLGQATNNPARGPSVVSSNGPGSSANGPDGGATMDGENSVQEEDSIFGLPTIFRNGDAPEAESDVTDQSEGAVDSDAEANFSQRYLSRTVPWSAPDYSRQEEAIGRDAATFKIPPGLAKRVAFWKEIYSKYTTGQGVLHDPDQPHVVYEVIDFAGVGTGARARTRLVDQRRAKVSERLLRLSRVKSVKELRDADDRRFLGFAYSGSPEELFLPSAKKVLSTVQAQLKALGDKRNIRFQLGQKDKFVLGVFYSGRYLREMERIFREERLPIELTRLPFVESSFNIQARSRVGASGIWQFMPRTAKPTMMVNRDVDERNDPLTATKAAARLLRSNFEQLRSWPLALTAYNHGAAGVARAVKKTGSRELSVIIDQYESRRFGFASSNFYACFLAAVEVEKNAQALLGEAIWSTAFDGAVVEVQNPLEWKDVIRFYDGESLLAELQNAHFTSRIRKGKAKVPKRTFIRVPLSRRELAEEWVRGRVASDALTARLQALPIVLPSLRKGGEGQDDISIRLGSLSEAAKSILPFLSDDEKATPSPTPNPVGPDGGPGL